MAGPGRPSPAWSRQHACAQVENFNVRLYRDLGIAADAAQAEHMAVVWQRWLRDRRALDQVLAVATALLNALPDSLAIPAHHLTHLISLSSHSTPPESAGAQWMLHAPADDGMNECHECCCGDTACQVGVDGGPEAWEVCVVCGVAEGVSTSRPGLLGLDHRSMAAAAAALRQLRQMQDSMTTVSVALLALWRQPGSLLSAEQLSRVARQGFTKGPPVDMLSLFQLAASQARHRELLRWPEVLTDPLPA